MTRYIKIVLRMVATAPENNMRANIRPIPIRPNRDNVTIGTTMVVIIRNARKKLNPRSSIQKGNTGIAGFVDFLLEGCSSNKIFCRAVQSPADRRGARLSA
jgi:hypothetical protein